MGGEGVLWTEPLGNIHESGEGNRTQDGKVTGTKRDNRMRPMKKPEALVSEWYNLRESRGVKSQRLRPRGLKTVQADGATRFVSRICVLEK